MMASGDAVHPKLPALIQMLEMRSNMLNLAFPEIHSRDLFIAHPAFAGALKIVLLLPLGSIVILVRSVGS